MLAKTTGSLERTVLGIVLIAIAAVVIVGRLAEGASTNTLAGVAIVCLAAFVATRSYGYAVAAGITGGLGLGVLVAAGQTPVAATDVAGAFMASLALGFAAAWLLGLGARPTETHPWPLVPAAILGTIGVALLSGTPALIDWLVVIAATVLLAAGVRAVAAGRRTTS